MLRLSGILAPVVTTFDHRGEITPDAFRANVRAHVGAGLHGVVVAGSTGEAPFLEEEERDRLVEWARHEVPEDRWLIAGAGAESSRQTARRAARAAERGADAVLVVAPHYFGSSMTPAALRAHYLHVADASPVPLVLYNIPKYMHFALDPALVAELAAHGNVAGIKDSSGDATLFGEYLAAQSPTFAVLTGSGAGLADARARGAQGGVLAVALFAPELALTVHEGEPSSGDVRQAQAALTPLAREIVGGLGVPGVKVALEEAGLHGGPPRLPLLPLEAPQRARVRELLRDARAMAAA